MGTYKPSRGNYAGSTTVGELSTDTHIFTGSVLISGTLTLDGISIGSGSISGSLVSASFYYGDGRFLTNVRTNTGKTLWVDSVNGDDSEAARGQFGNAYLTIGAALTDSISGDTVQILPGEYPEEGLSVPDGVTVRGIGGWESVRIGQTTATSDIMTIGDDSYVDQLAFNVPSAPGLTSLIYSGSAGETAGAYNITFYGDGSTGSGDGLLKTGPGKMIGAEIRCELGGVNSIMVVDAGVLAIESIHVPQSAGSIQAVSTVVSGARGQFVGHNAGNTNVTDAVYLSGSSSTTVIFNPNWFRIQNGLHIASEEVTAQLVAGQIDSSGFTVIVDNGITGSNSEVRIDGIFEPKFSFPPSALNTDFALSFLQPKSDTRNSAQRAFGSELQIGFPEKGTPSYLGEGTVYSDGITILTTDDTATTGSDGSNFIDVSTTGTVDDGNTITFQTKSAGCSILVSSNRFDSSGETLKHWGYDISQVDGDTTGSYIFETWDGTEWQEYGVQAVANIEQHKYSNRVFQRSSSFEEVRFGFGELDFEGAGDNFWEKKTINGTEAYWSRIRIAETGSALPTFNYIKVQPSFSFFNSRGKRANAGLAMWKENIVIGGNIFGETGGVVNASIPIGNGGVPTGWDHEMPNSQLNQVGDAIYLQFVIPNGTCTAFPLKFSVVYTAEGNQPVTTPATGTLSVLPIEVSGINVADPSGEKKPIPRTQARTVDLTTNAAQVSSSALIPEGETVPFDPENYSHSQVFDGYDISSFYEGDLLAVRFELEDDGTPNQDISVWAITVEGVKFTEGKEF